MSSKTHLFTKSRIRNFLSYYKPYRKIFAVDMAFALTSAAIALIFPLISGYITETVLAEWNSETVKLLTVSGVIMLVLVAVRMLSNVLYAYFGHAMGAKMEGDMRDELFVRYENQSFHFHSRESVGKLMTILSNDLTNMTELFHHGPEEIMMLLIKFVGSFVILININPALTAIVFSSFPLICTAVYFAGKRMKKGMFQMKSDLSDMNVELEDALAGIRTVKAFGNEAEEYGKFSKRNTAYVKSKCYFYKVEACLYEVMGTYPQVLTMLVVFFGALFIGQGSLDVPVLVTFLLYVSCLHDPVQTLVNFARLFQEGTVSFLRFMEMMEKEPAVKETETPVDLGVSKGEIRLEHVTFRYPGSSEDVLRDLSLTIGSGENVALVGTSGIGKTTVSSLVARFYDVTEGKISIDGVDIREISFASLRRNIGIVQQEVFIFNGTIRENIRFGRENATDEEIETAARLANANEFIEKLEHGYDTVVGTRGITLSGGQRQRISLARVFLKNPPILILDEATSSLDYESEVMVQKSIEALMRNRTCIVIAHRLSTVKNVQRIVVLKNRAVAEEGSHDELLLKGGEYARLSAIGNL